ncbi:MAG: hypothetical protein HGB15_03200 [Chlorobaculum sp.]|nr:hypothetical protein [Chlorobaculum sp.]
MRYPCHLYVMNSPVARIVWDGCDDSGTPLPAGSYRIAMNATGYSGSRFSDTRTVTLAR